MQTLLFPEVQAVAQCSKTWQEGRLAPHPQASEETPAGGDKFSAVQPSNVSIGAC